MNSFPFFTHIATDNFTVKNLKQLLLNKYELYDFNYKLFYGKRDISNFDNFTFAEIFLIKVPSNTYEINILINKTILEPKEQNVVMTFKEGEEYIYIYKTKSKRFAKAIPVFSYLCEFYKNGDGKVETFFPFNARCCNLVNPHSNRLVVTGGINHETMACVYEYDKNEVNELNNMKHKRQRHSMISVGDSKVFIIGGDNCNKCSCLIVNSDLYQEYPDMLFERKDPCLCKANDYLYVFMGYCNDKEGTLNNIERLNIAKEPFSEKWELLPLNESAEANMPRTYCSACYVDKNFILLGGIYKATAEDSVITVNEKLVCVKNGYRLPFGRCFGDPGLVFNEGCYYGFTFAKNEMIKFNPETKEINEIIDEYN